MVMRRAWNIKRVNSKNIFAICLKMAWAELKESILTKLENANYKIVEKDGQLVFTLPNGQVKVLPRTYQTIIFKDAGIETACVKVYEEWEKFHKEHRQTQAEKEKERIDNAKITTERVTLTVSYKVAMNTKQLIKGVVIYVDDIEEDIDYEDILTVSGFVCK